MFLYLFFFLSYLLPLNDIEFLKDDSGKHTFQKEEYASEEYKKGSLAQSLIFAPLLLTFVNKVYQSQPEGPVGIDRGGGGGGGGGRGGGGAGGRAERKPYTIKKKNNSTYLKNFKFNLLYDIPNFFGIIYNGIRKFYGDEPITWENFKNFENYKNLNNYFNSASYLIENLGDNIIFGILSSLTLNKTHKFIFGPGDKWFNYNNWRGPNTFNLEKEFKKKFKIRVTNEINQQKYIKDMQAIANKDKLKELYNKFIEIYPEEEDKYKQYQKTYSFLNDEENQRIAFFKNIKKLNTTLLNKTSLFSDTNQKKKEDFDIKKKIIEHQEKISFDSQKNLKEPSNLKLITFLEQHKIIKKDDKETKYEIKKKLFTDEKEEERALKVNPIESVLGDGPYIKEAKELIPLESINSEGAKEAIEILRKKFENELNVLNKEKYAKTVFSKL